MPERRDTFDREYAPYEVTGITPGEPFRIETGWWDWGNFINLASVGSTTEELPWTATFNLTVLDTRDTSRLFDGDKLFAGDVAGSSNYKFPTEWKEPRIKILDHVYVLKTTADGTLSSVIVENIEAPTSHSAMEIALAQFNILNAFLTFVVQLPLQIASAIVRKEGQEAGFNSRVYEPWPEVRLDSFSVTVPGFATIIRLIAMYAEGVWSNAAAYKFLCFFKIVDHVLTRANAFRRFHEERFKQVPWIELQDRLPNEPTRFYDVQLVDKTYVEARNRYRDSELRNAVGHVLSEEYHFEPMDPVDASHYRAAAVICRFMAQHLIRIVGHNSQAMLDAGATNNDLIAVLFPTRTPR